MDQAIQNPKPKGRLPKYKRAKTNAPGLEIQQRDIEILKLVYDYRFINSDQIKALGEGSDQVILRRLQKLFHHGFLDRPRQQIVYGRKGSISMIYALGNKGADILTEELGIDRGKIDWASKNQEVKERHIFHTIMISQIKTLAILAARGNPNLKIFFFRQDGDYTDCAILKKGGKKERIPIVPDGFLGIKYIEKDYFFFIEADRSTMTNERFLKKLKGYWTYWKEEKHKKKLNIENFRVLTITKTDARRDNLCKAAKKADDRQKGSQLFWFTSINRLTLEDPGKLFFSSIWKTAKGEGFQSLLSPAQKEEISLNSQTKSKILFEKT